MYVAYKGAKIRREGNKRETDYELISVDLEKDIKNNDEQIIVSEKNNNVQISLKHLLDIDYNYLRENFNDLHIDKIIQYHGIFNSYDFSTVVLRREDIDSVIEVFTRINTGGKTLTLFEIMSAKTYDEEQNFDMQSKFQEFLKELGDANYETISSSVILNVLSLILSENVTERQFFNWKNSRSLILGMMSFQR